MEFYQGLFGNGVRWRVIVVGLSAVSLCIATKLGCFRDNIVLTKRLFGYSPDRIESDDVKNSTRRSEDCDCSPLWTCMTSKEHSDCSDLETELKACMERSKARIRSTS
mmetsp:Transcript_6308/g.11246  ORF Transcript_6308/g.11246 Transcript_6308/m.11246 type:complete len:108 (-) Transcript_6308:393-716(-)